MPTDEINDQLDYPGERRSGPHRLRGRRLAVVAGGTALALTAGGIAVAATNSPSTSPTAGSSSGSSGSNQPGPWGGPGPGMMHDRHGFGPMGPGDGMGAGASLHGEFVVAKSGGGYQTIVTQRGTATAVTASSITVKSADGFTKTYSVPAGTSVDADRAGLASVHTGDQVGVLATVSGGTATAVHLDDESLRQSNQQSNQSSVQQ